MNGHRFPWSNLWTLGVSGAGIWLIVPCGGLQYWDVTVRYQITPLVLGPLGFAFIVALWQIWLAMQVGTEGLRLNHVSDPAKYYLRALRLLGSQKWLLWLFMCVAALNTAGPYVEVLLGRLRRADSTSMRLADFGPLRQYISGLPAGLTGRAAMSAPRSLLPLAGMRQAEFLIWPVLAAFAVVAIAYSIRRRVPADSIARTRLSAVFAVIAILSIAAGTFDAWEQLTWVSDRPMKASSSDVAQNTPARAPTRQEFARSIRQSPLTSQIRRAPKISVPVGTVSREPSRYILWLSRLERSLVSLLFAAIMAGGIFGTLKRHVGERKTLRTFIEDASKYFPSLVVVYAAVYLVAGGIPMPRFVEAYSVTDWVIARAPSSLVAIWRILPMASYLLLMIAPCVVVLANARAWDATKSAVSMWGSRLREIASFAAFGISLFAIIAVLNVPLSTVQYRFPRLSTQVIIVTAVTSAVGVLIGAIKALAVWEFTKDLGGFAGGENPVSEDGLRSVGQQ